MKYSKYALIFTMALGLQACSTTSEPEVECKEAYWKDQAMMYKEKADKWYEQAQMEQEKASRVEDEYKDSLRK